MLVIAVVVVVVVVIVPQQSRKLENGTGIEGTEPVRTGTDTNRNSGSAENRAELTCEWNWNRSEEGKREGWREGEGDEQGRAAEGRRRREGRGREKGREGPREEEVVDFLPSTEPEPVRTEPEPVRTGTDPNCSIKSTWFI